MFVYEDENRILKNELRNNRGLYEFIKLRPIKKKKKR